MVISVQVPESGVCVQMYCIQGAVFVCLCQLFYGEWMCCLEEVYKCDMLSVVNVYLDHLKFCVVCIKGRRYVCCSECNVVADECNESTSCHVQHIGTHGGEVVYFGCVCFRVNLVS